MESIWTKTCSIPHREPLQKDLETEVAVIGAGMAGILIAYLLQKAGKNVIVLDADRIASGQTKNTTAKITSQHDLIYANLIETFGMEKARQYAMANETAIGMYQNLIKNENIDCDFEETSAYIYAKDKNKLQAEVDAAVSLGLPASLTEQIPLPFENVYAVRFNKQAQFHPLKFIKHLSDNLEIYEKTPVLSVEEHLLKTPKATVTAEHIVFATHYPFINFPGLYFMRLHQERSYVLALENAVPSDGMYLGNGESSYSFRKYKNYLLFGGEGHRTGENKNGGRYDNLRNKAKELFSNAKEIAHWSAQDCIPADGIPYIGQYASAKPYWYVATGFQKWGMTSSMVSAMIIRDMIDKKENPYAEVFDPQRFSTEAAEGIACEMKEATKTYIKRFFDLPEETASELPAGHGGIIEINGEKTGVYKDENGEIHTVDIRCPHLGCQLEWNHDEKSWDCPCHGSRFDFRGNLINNPAQINITIKRNEKSPRP